MESNVHRELFEQQIAPYSITTSNGKRAIIPAPKKCASYQAFKKDFLNSLKHEELTCFNNWST